MLGNGLCHPQDLQVSVFRIKQCLLDSFFDCLLLYFSDLCTGTRGGGTGIPSEHGMGTGMFLNVKRERNGNGISVETGQDRTRYQCVEMYRTGVPESKIIRDGNSNSPIPSHPIPSYTDVLPQLLNFPRCMENYLVDFTENLREAESARKPDGARINRVHTQFSHPNLAFIVCTI